MDDIMHGQPLNTPEELRAIRAAVKAGQNPLTATDVPRWEDQVGVDRIINRRVIELEPLPTPAQVLAQMPLNSDDQDLVATSRDEIRAVLTGMDDRLLVIVGPCSVHDPKAALEYAHRLAALKRELDEQLLIVMRVYFEKPPPWAGRGSSTTRILTARTTFARDCCWHAACCWTCSAPACLRPPSFWNPPARSILPMR